MIYILSKKAKLSNRKVFELDGTYSITCWVYETRYSWGHYAEIAKNGSVFNETKYTYYNRTWESYQYQSIIHGLINKARLPDTYNKIADAIGEGNTSKELAHLRLVAVTAGILGTPDTQLKTLITATGGAITKPDDWDTLTDTEKKERLDKAIEVLS